MHLGQFESFHVSYLYIAIDSMPRRRTMECNQGLMKSPSGTLPDFGAIFMSNRSTKEECLRTKLFGLPLTSASFVEKVKIGMVLFLFEHEERKLYGVFEAISDGALNIVPHAYSSSGKHFSAQVLLCHFILLALLFFQDYSFYLFSLYELIFTGNIDFFHHAKQFSATSRFGLAQSGVVNHFLNMISMTLLKITIMQHTSSILAFLKIRLFID